MTARAGRATSPISATLRTASSATSRCRAARSRSSRSPERGRLRVTILLQALINGVMAGTLIAVPAIGFTAIFAVLRYPNFTVAAYTTIGAFAAWYANVRFGIGVLPGLIVAAVVAGATGV